MTQIDQPATIDDAALLGALFEARHRLSEHELHARAARIRDLAVEFIHTAHTHLAAALARTDIEQIEAQESLELFRLARKNAIEQLAMILSQLSGALQQAGANHPMRAPLQQFLHDNPSDSLSIQTTARLVQMIAQARAFVTMLPYPDQRDEELDECAQTLVVAQEEFEREESDVVNASNVLMAARDEAFVALLNARDLLRAALREAGELDQLDRLIPPPAQLF